MSAYRPQHHAGTTEFVPRGHENRARPSTRYRVAVHDYIHQGQTETSTPFQHNKGIHKINFEREPTTPHIDPSKISHRRAGSRFPHTNDTKIMVHYNQKHVRRAESLQPSQRLYPAPFLGSTNAPAFDQSPRQLLYRAHILRTPG